VQVIGLDRDVKRLAPSHELGGLAALGGETLVVPLAGLGRTELVMTLSGAIPVEADSVFQVVGPVVGTHLDSIRLRRIDAARRRYENVISQPGHAAERIALQVVAELVQSVNASGASLTLINNGASRRLVSFGPPAEEAAAVTDTCDLAPDRFVCGLPLSNGHRAVLEVRPTAGAKFSTEDADAATTCAEVLQTWLVGATPTFSDPTDVLEAPAAAPAAPAFERRIEEELERAKRFDLHLSLVLVDVSAPSQVVAQLQEALRRELRGSDLLGTTSGRHVAALLTHTDDRGLDNVVGRLRRRLAAAADRLNVADMKLGQAAMSADCRTADALLSRAAREAETIVVH
jgi:hypothetical protein